MTEAVFHPLGRAVAAVLLPLRVPPVAVVLANGAAGLAAAVVVFRGNLVAGAFLLLLKTVLDNADGQLARTSGRTSALGRYLDTEVDLVVNGALFVALAHVSGSIALAVVAFVALTFVLSADYNAYVIYRRARGELVVTQPSAESEGPVAQLLATAYGLVFAPQDRLLQSISQARLDRIAHATSEPDARRRATLAYHDRTTVAVLANLGLSTQLTALGVCLVAGSPLVYPWLVLGSAALVPLLQLVREHGARQALVR